MELFSQAILAILVAAATLVLVFTVKGRLLTPIGKGEGTEVFAVVRATGEAESLEHTLRGLRWLMDDGKIDMPIVIVAEDLDGAAEERARRLAQECGAEVCRSEDLDRVLFGT